jgi:hypothetical protein
MQHLPNYLCEDLTGGCAYPPDTYDDRDDFGGAIDFKKLFGPLIFDPQGIGFE